MDSSVTPSLATGVKPVWGDLEGPCNPATLFKKEVSREPGNNIIPYSRLRFLCGLIVVVINLSF